MTCQTISCSLLKKKKKKKEREYNVSPHLLGDLIFSHIFHDIINQHVVNY